MIAFVLAFISSTYVPPVSMPGWLQPFAKHQPVTPMVNAVRSALARAEQATWPSPSSGRPR